MKGGATFIRDNLEAFAVAIAMALVIRHYCIEAFRIPTASMNPTLLGDHRDADGARRHGDRILVDKFGFLRREPRRYEVIVFQYPLNRNKNFIKRLAGLPGEWLRIVDGDLWASRDEGDTWQVQRKPARAQDQLFFPFWPEPIEKPDAFAALRCWKGDAWRIDERDNRFAVDAGTEPARLEFTERVTAFAADGHLSKPYVGDVRVSFDLAVERAGTLVVRIREHGDEHLLELGPQNSLAFVDGEATKSFAVDVRLEAGESYEVSFANVDDTLIVEIDGDRQVFEFPAAKRPPSESAPRFEGSRWEESGLEIDARALKATLTNVRVDRDLHYRSILGPDHIWKIPEDHFFALGDNTRSSWDSRHWVVGQAVLKDGTVVQWEEPSSRDGVANPYASRPTDDSDVETVIEADVDGLMRRLRNDDVVSWESSVPKPFLTRDHLIGRAFSIFWPIYVPPIYNGPTRVNLIR